VIEAEASLERKQAVVAFDDSKTGAEALLRATKNAGLPATLESRQR
jgi:mercuric ion binding protein